MNFKGKSVAITGHSGFIGGELAKALELAGAHVVRLYGDVRDSHTFNRINHETDYIFHFGAPSSQVQFKRNGDYCIDVTINGLINAANAAKEAGARLVFPSTGLLSSDRYNEYAMGKKLSEDYVAGLGIDSVAIRIFATYGPKEGHKRDYASVPFLFARDILEGRRVKVFGDGTQVRDFLYIDDTVRGIMEIAERGVGKVFDMGSGTSTSFNKLLELLAKATGEEPKVDYVSVPGGYVQETYAKQNMIYKTEIDIDEGINRMVERMKEAMGK